MPYGASCTNGTDVCNSGQSAFWFSQVRLSIRYDGPSTRPPGTILRLLRSHRPVAYVLANHVDYVSVL